MKYQAGDYEAVHQTPIWRERANFIFSAFLGTKNGKNEWEQLWGERIGPRKFILCCIPFFAYDLALGDEIDTGDNFVFKEVTKTSGQITFRVWFGEIPQIQRDVIVEKIVKFNSLLEVSSKNLLGISVSSNKDTEYLYKYLYFKEKCGLLTFEIGNKHDLCIKIGKE
jgi:hypothetical protein